MPHRTPAIDPAAWHSHAVLNRVQSFLLLAVMGGLVAVLGEMIWGSSLIPMVSTVVALALFARSGQATRLMLRLYGARVLQPREAPQLYAVVRELARRAALPRPPAVAYVPSPMVNAFATGTGPHAVVAVTDGLLRTLDARELVAVLAHEVSHIRNNDLWVMALADMMTRLTNMLSFVGQMALVLSLPLVLVGAAQVNWWVYVVLIFAPTVSVLAQLGLSRTREFHADLNAVALTGDPEGLARALEKLERANAPWWERVLLPGRKIPEPSYLRTHPTTEERIRRLRELAGRVPHAGGAPPGRISAGPVPLDFLPEASPRPPRWHLSGLWY